MDMHMSLRYKLLIIAITSFLLFILPSVIRWYSGNLSIIGTPPYMHQRITGYILNGSFNWYDPLSFGGRAYTYPPLFSFIHAFFAYFLGLNLGGAVFVALFGSITAVFIYLIGKKFTKNNFLLALITMLIPGVIYMFSHLSTRSIPITFGLIAIYFFLEKRYSTTAVFLGISAIAHPETGVYFFILSAAFFIFYKIPAKNLIMALILAVLVASSFYIPHFYFNGLPQANEIHEDYKTRKYSLEGADIYNYFWESGRGYLTIPVFIIALFGLLKTKHNVLKFWFLLSLLLSLIAERFFIYIPLITAFFVVFSLDEIQKHLSKKAFIIILAVFIAYSSFFAATRILSMSNEWPNYEQYKAFTWIKENTPENTTVLADWPYGHWITGISDRKNFIDGYAEYAPEANKRLNEMNGFFEQCKIPKGYGIGYAYAEEWFVREKNITCFNRLTPVYNSSGYMVYEII